MKIKHEDVAEAIEVTFLSIMRIIAMLFYVTLWVFVFVMAAASIVGLVINYPAIALGFLIFIIIFAILIRAKAIKIARFRESRNEANDED